jgi:hypothetical protein
MAFREGRCGEGTAPLGWEAENTGSIGGCSGGRAEHPSLRTECCLAGMPSGTICVALCSVLTLSAAFPCNEDAEFTGLILARSH